ncbi:homocysteine S-methyltransferase family protein [Pelotomaculum terephthalicicum JT]|uniref:homocysteine S-methyltransferase family protein n=1 Tax=Pelotomaculum TaxID=191373 RepID=UPI0009CAD2A3|nr:MULTISPECIES: homocysteine S-methyltransferase family protein [Pelotomaculum]MCG9967101.1 homocysteine S-methyltransferase family protein [Pelotomaculum terephthalicicum JT]OPX87801.1 MAG: Methionine synthase [Pelotomaculum sp. PtaB.Bin117]OPY63853.1 MAG: Methionine synthase [Pelotomaculum sp. PtaU1.Bin065]
MNKDTFRQMTQGKIVLLDGATGTELHKRGIPKEACPEQWVLEHPHVLKEIQSEYIEAGSDIVLACTFGGNRIKLKEFGLQDRVLEFNRALAGISKEAAGARCLVAGDLAPTGKFVEPFGDAGFNEIVDVYKEQVQGLLAGGVDLFVIETMIDLQETRAAVLAIKETCDLPVIASMTFDTGAKTLTDSDPVTVLITLQSLGVDAVGANCSTGPKDMLKVVELMAPYAKVPIMVKPNAGLPRLVDGHTVFDMGPEEFGKYAVDFVARGVGVIGGCCGTTPQHIKSVNENIAGLKPAGREPNPYRALTSSRRTVFFGDTYPVTVVGERINPTGKKKLSEELKNGKLTEVRRLAAEQVENGAEILDVNVGMPGIDEKKTMVEVVKLLSNVVECPLCLDSSSPDVLAAALRIYPGRALINSISAEKAKIQRMLPIARKYGAMFILLPLSDEGVPEQARERYEIIENVISEAKKHGFENSDIVVDGLVMSVSSNQSAAEETLKVIRWCAEKVGCATIAGLSNVSFGLPRRDYLNSAFLAMGVGCGLSMAIANPSSEMIMDIKAACDVLTARDKNSLAYIKRYSEENAERPKKVEQDSNLQTVDRIKLSILEGDRENVVGLIEEALAEGVKSGVIIDDYLIPAITRVGHLYEERKYFLPQLIQSAEAMKTAFNYLAPLLAGDRERNGKNSPVVVLATVKGDIHDIGKNIVGLMLRNNGFTVHDLGKNVSAEKIIGESRELQARIIGLSALLTTTMVEMKTVVELGRSEGLDVKYMVGGAVVNESFAREIRADGYAKDAYEAVRLAKRLTGLE